MSAVAPPPVVSTPSISPVAPGAVAAAPSISPVSPGGVAAAPSISPGTPGAVASHPSISPVAPGAVASVPVLPVASGAVTIDPELVDNNSMIATPADPGAAVNGLSIATSIDATTNRTALAVGIAGRAVTVTSGDKRVMRVTANFGTGVETSDLVYQGQNGGKPWYESAKGYLRYEPAPDSYWALYRADNDAIIESNAEADFPDQLSWGVATITAVPASANHAIAAVAASGPASALLSLSNAPGSNGSGPLVNAGPVTLTGTGIPPPLPVVS